MASLDLRRDGLTIINLLDNTNYAVELGREKMEVHTGDRQTLVYTVNIFGTGASENLARADAQANLDALVEALDQARLWHTNRFSTYPILLRRVNDGEDSDGATALVYDYSLKFKSTLAKGASQLLSPHLTVDLALTVGPWEKGEGGTEIMVSESLAADGGFVEYEGGSGFAARDSRLHARIGIGLSVGVQKLWMGIQPYRQVGVAAMGDFDPVWKLEGAVLGTDTSLTADSDSLGTNVASVSFATNEAMVTRATMGNPGSYITSKGPHMLLLRCRVTNVDTDVFVRVGAGFVSTNVAYNEAQRLTAATTWTYLPMGVVTFPPAGDRETPFFSTGSLPSSWGLAGYELYLDAERNAGTGSLRLDGYVLIPYDHYIALENVNVPLTGGQVFVVSNPDGTIEAIEDDGSTYYGRPTIADVNNWSFPYDRGDNYGILVVAAQRSQVATSKTLSVSLRAHPGAVFYG